MLKVGIVGCGGIGLIHSRAYQSHPRAQLVCVCDIVKEKADARAKMLGVKAYYSIKEMLANEDLDAIGVITADHLHFAPTMEVLDAGKHVLVEKPLSLNIYEAEQMVAKAEEKGVQLAIDYNRRYARPYLKAKEYVDNGLIGKLAYVMMKLSQGGPASSAKGPYYLLFELETHAFDMMRHFGGDIIEVSAQMAAPRAAEVPAGETVVYTSIAISVKFANEAVGTLMASWDSAFTHPIELFEVCGRKGYLQVENIVEGVKLFLHDDQTVRSWKPSIFATGELTFEKIFENRVHAFVDDILNNRTPYPTGLDGLKALQVVQAAIDSFEQRKTVRLI
ncbi:Gfo/Idh/MocA family oxidoreductase [Candidatus Poribacteria bacterium]|nr:Gfo/Idh/MocA family oxidoreductase [Candidatus Poribacteria bacterium]